MAGPCSWDVEGSICCSTWADYSAELQAQSIRWATYLMWAATGRQFDSCTMTVYPCGRDGSGNCDGAWGYWWDDGVFLPYIWQGQWFNAVCGCDGLGCWACKPRGAAFLPGPVQSVASVTVDGSVVDPSTYRVWDQQWLTKIGDDDHWPVCQDFNKATLDFKVVYVRGTPPPQAVLDAAGTLACEYAKACLGADCQLPSRVVNIARQGVTVDLQSIESLLRDGFTGITIVDQLIAQINPHRLKGRTRLYSPDVPVARVIT